MKKKILISGVSGLLGNNLAIYFRNKYQVIGSYLTHPVYIEGVKLIKCDFTDNKAVENIISLYQPDIIIHCVSLTDIELCQINRNHAQKLNTITTKIVVDNIHDKKIKLVYISSDSVYSGIGKNYSEIQEVTPQHYYGQTKLEGEYEALKKIDALVLRTNIYGWNIQDKQSLGEWILSQLERRQTINGFVDAHFSAIYTFEFAKILDIAIKKNIRGIYNCGCNDSCSKYEFFRKIANWFDFDDQYINPISIDDSHFKTRRGKNLSFNVNKLHKALGYKLPSIDQSIESFYRDFKCGLQEEIKKYFIKTTPKLSFIPYGMHWIDEKDINEVVNVLESKQIAQGLTIEAFQTTLNHYCNARYSIAVNSGTSALHIACLACGLQPGDEVITTPITFVASVNCACFCGATPVFADIDPKTYNISVAEIEKKITPNTKIIIPVHFAGQSCEMESLHAIIKVAEKKYGRKIYIIEDASHALGSYYKQKKVGSCTYSDMAVLSFHPVKHITTGEGGAVLTNDKILINKMRVFAGHGIDKNKDLYKEKKQRWYYEQRELGYNYRISDINCSLGISQLKKLGYFISRRREIVDQYNKAFKKIKHIQIPFEAKSCNSNFHLYVLLFDFEQIGIERNEVMAKFFDMGIQTQVHYIPVHTQPYYQNHFNTDWGDLPKAENYYKKCLSLPLFPTLTDIEVSKVITVVKTIIQQ